MPEDLLDFSQDEPLDFSTKEPQVGWLAERGREAGNIASSFGHGFVQGVANIGAGVEGIYDSWAAKQEQALHDVEHPNDFRDLARIYDQQKLREDTTRAKYGRIVEGQQASINANIAEDPTSSKVAAFAGNVAPALASTALPGGAAVATPALAGLVGLQSLGAQTVAGVPEDTRYKQAAFDATLALGLGVVGPPAQAFLKTRPLWQSTIGGGVAALGANEAFAVASDQGPGGEGDAGKVLSRPWDSPDRILFTIGGAAGGAAASRAGARGVPEPTAPVVDPAIAQAATEAAARRVQGRKLLPDVTKPKVDVEQLGREQLSAMGYGGRGPINSEPVIEDPMARQRTQGISEKEAILKNYAAKLDAEQQAQNESARQFEEQQALQDQIEAHATMREQETRGIENRGALDEYARKDYEAGVRSQIEGQSNQRVLDEYARKDYEAGVRSQIEGQSNQRVLDEYARTSSLPTKRKYVQSRVQGLPDISEIPPLSEDTASPTGPNPLTSFSQLRKQGLPRTTEPTDVLPQETTQPVTSPLSATVEEPGVVAPEQAVSPLAEATREEAVTPPNTEPVPVSEPAIGKAAGVVEHLSPEAQTYFNEQPPAIQKELMSTVNARTNRLDTAGDLRNLEQHVKILEETKPQLFKEKTNAIPQETSPISTSEKGVPEVKVQGKDVAPSSSLPKVGEASNVLKKGPRAGSVSVGGGPKLRPPSDEVAEALEAIKRMGIDTAHEVRKLGVQKGETPGAPGTRIATVLHKLGVPQNEKTRSNAMALSMITTQAAESPHIAKAQEALIESEARRSSLSRRAEDLKLYADSLGIKTPEQQKRVDEMAKQYRLDENEDFTQPVTVYDPVRKTTKVMTPTPVESQLLTKASEFHKENAAEAEKVRQNLEAEGLPATSQALNAEIQAKLAEINSLFGDEKAARINEVEHLKTLHPIVHAAENMHTPAYTQLGRHGEIIVKVTDNGESVATESFHNKPDALVYEQLAKDQGYQTHREDFSRDESTGKPGEAYVPGFLKHAENIPGADISDFTLSTADSLKRFAGFMAKAELTTKMNKIMAEAPEADRLFLKQIMENYGNGKIGSISSLATRLLAVKSMALTPLTAAVQGTGGMITSFNHFMNFSSPKAATQSTFKIAKSIMRDLPPATVKRLVGAFKLNSDTRSLLRIWEDGVLARLGDPTGELKRAFQEGFLAPRNLVDTGQLNTPSSKIGRGFDDATRAVLFLERAVQASVNTAHFRVMLDLAKKNLNKEAFWNTAADKGYAGGKDPYNLARWSTQRTTGLTHAWAKPLALQKQGVTGEIARTSAGLLNYTLQQSANAYVDHALAPVKAAQAGRGAAGIKDAAMLAAATAALYQFLGPNILPLYSTVHGRRTLEDEKKGGDTGWAGEFAREVFGSRGEEAVRTVAQRSSPVSPPTLNPDDPFSAIPMASTAKNVVEGLTALNPYSKEGTKTYTQASRGNWQPAIQNAIKALGPNYLNYANTAQRVARGENTESAAGTPILTGEETTREGRTSNTLGALAGFQPVGIDEEGRQVSTRERQLENSELYKEKQDFAVPKEASIRAMAQAILDTQRGKISGKEQSDVMDKQINSLVDIYQKQLDQGIVLTPLTDKSLKKEIENELIRMQNLPGKSKVGEANRQRVQGITRGEAAVPK